MSVISGVRFLRASGISCYRLVLGGGEVVLRLLLWLVFRFDPWHVRAPYSWRPYKREVVDVVRDRVHVAPVVEVGCGLGDIVWRCRGTQKRIGIDMDQRVLSAARLLHPGPTYHQSTLHELGEQLSRLGVVQVSDLIMINWSHEVPTAEFVDALRKLTDSIHIERILIDCIRPEAQSYRHHHSVSDLAALGVVTVCRTNLDEVRDLVAIVPLSRGTLAG